MVANTCHLDNCNLAKKNSNLTWATLLVNEPFSLIRSQSQQDIDVDPATHMDPA